MMLWTVEQKFEDAYNIESLLGVGSFGVVLEVRNLHTGQISALKVLSALIFLDHQLEQPRTLSSHVKRTHRFARASTSKYH